MCRFGLLLQHCLCVDLSVCLMSVCVLATQMIMQRCLNRLRFSLEADLHERTKPHVPCHPSLPREGLFRGGCITGTCCKMDLSSLGACHCIQQDTTNTVQQGRHVAGSCSCGLLPSYFGQLYMLQLTWVW